jgi:hypothetical protein
MSVALAATRITYSRVMKHQATAAPQPDPGGVWVTMDWHRGLDAAGKRHPDLIPVAVRWRPCQPDRYSLCIAALVDGLRR